MAIISVLSKDSEGCVRIDAGKVSIKDGVRVACRRCVQVRENAPLYGRLVWRGSRGRVMVGRSKDGWVSLLQLRKKKEEEEERMRGVCSSCE